MRWPRVRLTLGRLMVGVACCAVLIPFPFRMLWGTLVAAMVWSLILLIASRIPVPVVRSPVWLEAVALGVLVVVLAAVSVDGTWLDDDMIKWLFGGLVAANLAGPVVLASRIRRGRSTAGGEWLWAWSGLVWTALLVYPLPPIRGAGLPDDVAEAARLILVAALLLALYGPRPVAKESAWAHHNGWLIVECDVIVSGIYASQSLW